METLKTEATETRKNGAHMDKTEDAVENATAATETAKFVYVSRKPSSRFSGSWDYYRSDEPGDYEDGEVYATWSDAYDAGSGAPYANPVGYDWEAVTVDEADHVWAAIDGRDGDVGFAAAFALAAEYGAARPSDEDFAAMDDANEWPAQYAWSVLGAMSQAHANRRRAEG